MNSDQKKTTPWQLKLFVGIGGLALVLVLIAAILPFFGKNPTTSKQYSVDINKLIAAEDSQACLALKTVYDAAGTQAIKDDIKKQATTLGCIWTGGTGNPAEDAFCAAVKVEYDKLTDAAKKAEVKKQAADFGCAWAGGNSEFDYGDGESTDDLIGIDLTIDDVFNIIYGFACWLWSVSMFIIVIAIIWVGIRMMGSQSNATTFTAARTAFVHVLVGAIVIMGVYVIIATVAGAVGVDISLVPFDCSSGAGDGDEEEDAVAICKADCERTAAEKADCWVLETQEAKDLCASGAVYECQQKCDSGGGSDDDSGGNQSACDDPQSLADINSEPYPRQNAPELDSLIACVKGKLPGQDLGSEATYDVSHPLCNYTRGEKTCDSVCSHAVNSCHYGGRTGTTGARAVNFGNETIGDQIIQAARDCGSKSPRCLNAQSVTVACSSASATIVYVNTTTCDSN